MDRARVEYHTDGCKIETYFDLKYAQFVSTISYGDSGIDFFVYRTDVPRGASDFDDLYEKHRIGVSEKAHELALEFGAYGAT
jgi:hypothetical protein